ncbi:MAG: PAS domain S-box protein, partial [Alcaligenaceae bacterium]
MTSQNKPDIDYTELFRSLPGRYLVMDANDPDFTIIEENDAHTEVAMVARDTVLGKPFFDVFPDTSDYFKEHGVSEITLSFRKVLATKRPDTMEALKYDIKDKHGVYQERWWQATHYPMCDINGTVTAIFQQTQDITEQIKSDAALAQTKYQLDEALAVGQIGTWAWDIEHDIVIADKNLARMFGVDALEAANGLSLKVFTDSIYIDDRPEVLKRINLAIEQDTAYEVEYRTVSRDGTIRWVIARGRVTKNSDGTPASFTGILVDISERKIAETNLAFLADASALLSTSLDYSRTLRKISNMIVPEIADWCSIDVFDSNDQLSNIVLSHKDEKEAESLRKYRAEHILPLLNISSGIGKVIMSGEPIYYPDMLQSLEGDDGWSQDVKRKITTMNMTSAIITPLIVREKVVGAITFATTGLKRPFSTADLAMLVDLTRRASLAMTNADYITESRRQIAELEQLKT